MSCRTWQQLATLAGPVVGQGALSITDWLVLLHAKPRHNEREEASEEDEHVSSEEDVDSRLNQRPWSPDIRWLGTVVESWGQGGYTHDYTEEEIHPTCTDLRHHGHRNRFGEKALKHGGVDFTLRTLTCFPVDMCVGYNGVLDVFGAAKGGPLALLHELPKVKFFLQHWPTLIAPRLAASKPKWCGHNVAAALPTAQDVANSLLSYTINQAGPGDEARKALVACRTTLGAQLVAPGHVKTHEAAGLGCTGGGWAELFAFDDDVFVQLLYTLLKARAHTFPPYARGDSYCLSTLLRKTAWASWDDFDFTVRLPLEGNFLARPAHAASAIPPRR